MVDTTAFRSLSYGLYIISTRCNDAPVGCVVNTFSQVTSKPAQASIAINKDNHTTEGIRQSGAFEAVVLDQTATMELIGQFGFHSSVDVDKFVGFAHAESEQGLPYVADHVCAHFSVKVTQEVDLGSHVLFIGDVVAAEAIGAEEPMTYAYYHQVKGGKTPPKAPSYNEEAPMENEKKESKVAWRCTICGHIEYVDELPDDFVCPICGVGKDLFERIEV